MERPLGRKAPLCASGILPVAFTWAGETRELPLCGGVATPLATTCPRFLSEGGSWTKGSVGLANEAIGCRGVCPLHSSGMVSPAAGFVSAAKPTSSVQERLSHWPGEVAISHREWDSVPHIYSLDAKDCGDEGVLLKNKQTKNNLNRNRETEMLCVWPTGRHIVGTLFTCVIELKRSLRKNAKRSTTNTPASLF